MRNAFFFAIILGLLAGILIRTVAVVPTSLLLLCCGLSGVITLLVYRFKQEARWVGITVVLFLFTATIGVWRTDVLLDALSATPLSTYEQTEVLLRGVVREAPDVRDRSVLITVDTHGPAGGRVLVFAQKRTEIDYGDEIAVFGTLTTPEPFEGDFGRVFDYPSYLLARGITHTLRSEHIEIGERSSGISLLKMLYATKQSLVTSVETALPEPAAALGLGITLGEKRALGEELLQSFKVTGLIHIVVLSGYNLAIFAALIMRLVTPVFSKTRQLFIGGGAIVLLVLMVGPSAAVVRAGLMALLVLLAHATGKTYEVLRGLFFVGALMLFLNPLLLFFDPGFQFSFLATLGLIVLSPLLEQLFSRVPSLFELRNYLVGTVAAQIMVLPLLVYKTGLLSLVSVVANLMVLPLTPLAMFLTALTALCGLFSNSLALGVGYLSYIVLSLILLITEWLSALPYAAVPVPLFSWVYVALTYIGMGIGWYVLKQWLGQRNRPFVGGVPAFSTKSPEARPPGIEDLPFR